MAVVIYGGEGADVSTHIFLYVDGELQATSKKSVLKINTDVGTVKATNLIMGRNAQNYLEGKSALTFKGSLDEVYIFDKALNGEQIRSLKQKNQLP